MKYLILALLSLPAFAIPERGYQSVWLNDVLGPLDSVQAQEFTNRQGKKVRFRTYHRGDHLPNIVISPGRTEPMKKYFELMHDLGEANYYLIDHQGQGESERALSDPDKGYVRSYKHFVDDFTFWMENHVQPATKGKKLYLIAHSMGAAIATRFMETHPKAFHKVALSSPMYDIFTKPYPGAVARVFSRGLILAGRATEYAPDRKPYIPAEDTIEVSEVTHSPARLEMNKWLFETQNLALGGPTVRWVNEAFALTKSIQKVGSKLSMPILIFQAAEDIIVKPEPQIAFCKLAKNCRLIKMEGAFHEVLQEKDSIRDQVLNHVRKHLGL